MVHAFVHTLSLAEGWAYCLDLPMPFGVGPAWAHAIAVSRDGFRLFVADRSSGTIAVADTQTLQLKGSYAVGMDPLVEPGEAAIDVAPDGTLYVASGSVVLVFSAAALGAARTARQRWPLPGAICGLKLSQDAQRVYVGLADRVVILSTVDGHQIGQLDVPEVDGIAYVGRAAS
jgi:DNA-binding beta-propeller fold protein YncE